MSLLTEPASTADPVPRRQRPGRLAVWEPGVVLVLLGLFALTGAGWFSADEVPVAQQVERLTEHGTWPVDEDAAAAAVDPDHRFHLLARSDRIDGAVVPYAKHPLYPVLLWPLGKAGPDRLPFVLGALAGVAGAAAVSAALGWSRPAFWLTVGGTTIAFHTGVLWAHAPAFGLGGLAALGLSRAVDPDARSIRWAWMALVSAALAGAVLLRTEALLLAGAVTVSLAWRERTDLRRTGPLVLVPVLGAVVAYWAEPMLTEIVVGPASGSGALVASGRDLSVAGRLSVLRIMAIEPSIIGGGRAVLRVVGVLLLCAGVGLARSSDVPGRAVTVVAAAAALCYAGAYGAGAAPGLLVAMPLVALLTIVAVVSGRARRSVFVPAFVVFAALVVGTSYDSAGGGDWGGRYLFVGVPLLLVGIGPTLVTAVADARLRPLVVAAILAALAVQLEIVVDHYSRGSTVDVVDATAGAAAARLDDPATAVAVSDERLARFLYDRGLRGASFHVPAGREAEFGELLDQAGITRIIWVDLSSNGADRPGRLVETHGSVEMRTLVRR